MVYEVQHDNSEELERQNKSLRKEYGELATQFDNWATVAIFAAAKVRAVKPRLFKNGQLGFVGQ
jgi:hypothetical protein